MLTFAVTREDFAILCNKVELCEISIKYPFLNFFFFLSALFLKIN